MKKYLLLLMLIVLLLASCVPASMSSPTATVTATSTLTNTPIPTPTLTPTPTVVPIPEFMNEFIELGYDKQELESTSIYVVLDEKSIRYSTNEWGTNFNKSILYGWSKVHYLNEGLLQTNFVLIHFCVPHPTINNNFFCYFTPSDNINIGSNNPPFSTKWTKAMSDFIQKHSVGDYPIVRIEFNSEHFDARNNFSNYPNFSFWKTLYPNYNLSFSTFDIPNIGTFLPATYIGYDFSEGKWINNP